ncbi:MAG TPA: 1-(5-phosphoribosyl)-5-[(5-phosphoribosylamino)methylideneamino]imidazole-4-carboxamide isomerase [Woeseiaceae bacterium]|nr:1-(5-phosphoribosyl)-5-[(5-phosphoribosylamino)methylideneamino]imidazole-4-carboxamide isomerase [Woeseiaceae bacterium]
MKIFPAIDLKDGSCVRLLQGDFDRKTEYSNEPVAVARHFADLAVTNLHVVDLDGALHGAQRNARVVEQIVATCPLEIQLGGGIRERAALQHWLSLGVARCVIGSVAVRSPATVLEWAQEFGSQKLVVALDVLLDDDGTPMLATHGWKETRQGVLWDCIDTFYLAGFRQLLCTDIERDGALTGPNLDLYTEILRRYPDLELQASGGVRNVGDLTRLRTAGVPAVITGRALLDGKISADEVASFRPGA